MLWIKTIDFPDGRASGTLGTMDTNLYALDVLVRERLTVARAESRRQDLVALASAGRPGARARLGAALIALGEWLRGEPALAPAGQP